MRRTEVLRVRVTPAERELVRWLARERATSEGSVLRWALRKAIAPQAKIESGGQDSEAQAAAL